MEERWWKVNQNGPRFSMSNEKKTPGCLGCIYIIYIYIYSGFFSTQLYGDVTIK